MGKVCVAGCGELDISYKTKTIKIKGKTINEGDYISINGSTGEVFVGEVKTIPSEVLRVLVDKTLKPEESQIYQDFESLMKWADEARRLGVRTNADQPDQAQVAVAFGAEGIGLCRTEHMFFEGERIDAVREMIVAEDLEGRKKALAKLLPMQKGDFAGLFRVMNGLPVTIRTLDPPLHEFLPHGEKDIARPGRQDGHHLRAARGERWRASRRQTPCWVCAGAGSASSTPRSRRCRRGPCSRPPAT